MACCGSNSPGGRRSSQGAIKTSVPNPSAGRRTSYGGRTTIERTPCEARPCPSPLTSDAEDRDPYCPSWIDSVTGAISGRITIFKESCLYFLRSKCTGWLFQDGETGEVTVQDPPFVSRIPTERDYGFIAKVIPQSRLICDDTRDDCPAEAVQELASQEVGESACGDLMLVNSPLAGEVPTDEAADLDKQVNVSRASLPDLDDMDTGCDGGIKFLATVPMTRSDNSTPCKGWVLTPRLRQRKADWGLVDPGDVTTDFKGLILKPIPGCSGDNQRFELCMFDGQPINVDTSDRDLENCDMLKYKDGVWKPYKGMVFRPVSAAAGLRIFNYANESNGAIKTISLPEFPDDACGDVHAVFHSGVNVTGATVAADITFSNFDTAFVINTCGFFNDSSIVNGSMKLSNGATLRVKIARNSQTATRSGYIDLMGYYL